MENQLTLSNAIGDPRGSNTSAIQEEHHAEFTPSDDNATFKPGIIMNHIQDGPNNDFVYQSFVDNNETSEMDYGIIAAEIRNNNQEDTDLQLETTSIDDDVHYDSEDNQINRIYDSPMISEEGSFAIVTTEDQLDIR
ncbi:Protein CBG25397 [Caenorhabditis briggsae]|uniref:Protein CBG25397 n=1 Tax=Caenorhabditis briggsae TaxID=6238 RepID=B6IH49_CAEBR|nr:Protein CBG25397 [Caenorhabditis briggsae]CAR99229.1 Protein CBG25397 [Caenorhabditis briggsae]